MSERSQVEYQPEPEEAGEAEKGEVMADKPVLGEAHIFCLWCRSEFTDEQIKGHSACPSCGSKGVPGDAREKATLTLTHHEWQVLFIWADNWAGYCDRNDPNVDAAGLMQALMREAKRQVPTMPSLSLAAEMQDVANHFGRVEIHAHGETTVIDPETKH